MSDFEAVQPRMPTPPRRPPPPGSCDSHGHVFGPFDRFPLQLPSSYPPPDAPLARYLQMLDIVGNTHGCVIAPAPYGEAAEILTDAIAGSKGRLTAIAVAGPQTTPEHLRALDKAGVRGLRFVDQRLPNGERYAGSVSADDMAPIAATMADLGWRAHLWGPAAGHAGRLETIRQMGVDVVLDHMGNPDITLPVDQPAYRTILDALEAGQLWVKLTLCRVQAGDPTYPQVRPFHDALVAANPERLIWGSDWPFVRMGEGSPDVGHLLDILEAWVPDEATRRRILVDNPKALFGF